MKKQHLFVSDDTNVHRGLVARVKQSIEIDGRERETEIGGRGGGERESYRKEEKEKKKYLERDFEREK